MILGVGTAGLLVADVAYGLIQLNGSWQVGGPTDLGWVLCYAGWAAAALHPSMVELTEPARSTVQRRRGAPHRAARRGVTDRARRAAGRGEPRHGPRRRRHRRPVRRHVRAGARPPRRGDGQPPPVNGPRAGAAGGHHPPLVSAADTAETLAAVRRAVPTGCCRTGSRTRWSWCGPNASTNRGWSGCRGSTRRSGSCCAGTAPRCATRWASSATCSTSAARRGAAGAAATSRGARLAGGTGAGAASRSTAEINRRNSEEYFRTLVHNTSDVILIVDDDDRPVREPVGREPSSATERPGRQRA